MTTTSGNGQLLVMDKIESYNQLQNFLSTPSPSLLRDIKKIDGDIMLLGAGGKMGPSLARLAQRAVKEAGSSNKIVAVSRFSNTAVAQSLEADGIEVIKSDLLNEAHLQALPDVPNIIYLAGMKFGTTGNEEFVWAMNAYLPGCVAEHFKQSRSVIFSTGNVYPLSPVILGGCSEEHSTGPMGEYAQSCLARERVFTYFSNREAIPMLLFRLNYANDLRYGVLLDVAIAVQEGRTIDLSMGHVNVVWQGYANELAIRALCHCSIPPKVLNVTGPETVSIRWLAICFGELLEREPNFTGEEQPTALLSNASEAHRLFGYPHVTLRHMICWTAHWVRTGGPTLDKSTHFQERRGKF